MIELSALGPVDIRKDGSPPTGRSLHRKNLALLAYLGRSPNRTRTRDHLVGVLWAEKEDQSARHSLRQAISDLKADLGDELFVTSSDAVTLTDAVEFDFEQFETLRATEHWAEASRLIRGEFMEGFSVAGASALEDWLSHERATWRRRSVETILSAAEERLTAGAVAAAADLASGAMAMDVHADAAVQMAMRCAAVEGNPAGALDLFERFVEKLSELNLEPNAVTRRLADSVQQERQWRIPRPVPEAPEPTRRTPLVGRSAELTAAMMRWSESLGTSVVNVLLVEGEQGTGKTRLAEEIAARSRLDGAQAAWIRSVESDRDADWSGIAGLFLGGLLDTPGLASADSENLAAVAAIVPELKERFTIRSGATPPPLDLAVPHVLRTASDEQPLVLVFDDAHYLDPHSLELIQALARDLKSCPVLIVLTMSPQHPRPEIEELRSRIGREIKGLSLHLGLFDDEAIRVLSAAFVSEYDGAQLDRLTRRIAVDSGRIPLLVVELLHAVTIGVDLDEATPDWPQPGRTLDQTAPGELPDAVIGAIRAAYWRAAENARKVLLVVAAVDGRVSRRRIREASGLSDPALDEALDWLEWERWLVSERRGYAYAARIVRDVIARDMLTAGQADRYRRTVAGAPES